MRRYALVTAVLLALAAGLLSGCEAIVKSGIEQATGVKVEGNQITATKDGETISIGGTEEGALPEGFPADFPMFDPITITSGVKAEANGVTHYTITASTTGSFEAVQGFYADKLKAAGWDVKVEGTARDGAGAGSVNSTKGEDKANIALVKTGPDADVELVMSLSFK